MSASHENREPREVVGSAWPSGSEARRAHLWICMEEAPKFTVGHVWAGGSNARNIDGDRVLELLQMELLQKRWVSLFARMHTFENRS